MFCATCGAANSRCRKGKLNSACTGRLEAGSAWRLVGLMQGKCSAWLAWPDGRPATTRINMQKVDVGVDRFVAGLNLAEQKDRLVAVLSSAEQGELENSLLSPNLVG